MEYATPDGYYDLPWIYVYDGDGLVNGQNAMNQVVNIESGLGDFYLRRVCGADRLLNPSDGRFQMRDEDLRYIEASPVYIEGGGEWPIIPELHYAELHAIRFDLYDVLKS